MHSISLLTYKLGKFIEIITLLLYYDSTKYYQHYLFLRKTNTKEIDTILFKPRGSKLFGTQPLLLNKIPRRGNNKISPKTKEGNSNTILLIVQLKQIRK